MKFQDRPTEADPAEADCFDWYGPACSCGTPDCQVHPRARDKQRPPEGDWRAWMMLMGRGYGKTRSGAEWVRMMIESGRSRRMALVGPTAADVRDVMIEGESGILAVCPPWNRPKYEASKRRLTWPNGAIATAYSAEEPDRLRGPQHDAAWLDELAAWFYPKTYDMLMFGLRLGTNPQTCITTTPKATPLVKRLVEQPTTVVVKGSTYENRANLAPQFFDEIVATYEGTRLGRQEIHAEILELIEGVWFADFDGTEGGKHVTPNAEYVHGLPVHLAVDCGTSQHTGAVFFQVRQIDAHRRRVNVFGDFYSVGSYSAATAAQLKTTSDGLPSQGRIDTVRLDPAASARTGVGPAAYGEFERVFGSRITSRWPSHGVVDGLDQIEIMLDMGCLVVHPRCNPTIAAFKNYKRAERGGIVLNYPADPQNPHEDMMDALRGGIRDRFPEGRPQLSTLRTIHARSGL
jgi:hypothetical protein